MIGCLIVLAIASLSCVAQEVTVADQAISQGPVPVWAIVIGGILACVVIVVVGIYLIRYYVRRSGIAATAPDLSFRQDDSTVASMDCEKQQDHKSKLGVVPEISSLPYPPSSSLLLSDKLELGSSEEAAALYQTYLHSFEQQQQQKNSNTMASTLRNTLRRSMGRQQKPSKTPSTTPLQDMFDQHSSSHSSFDSPDRPAGKRSTSVRKPQTNLFGEYGSTKKLVEEPPLPPLPAPAEAVPVVPKPAAITKPFPPIPAKKDEHPQQNPVGNEAADSDIRLPTLQRNSITEQQQQEKEVDSHWEMYSSVQSKQLVEIRSSVLDIFHQPEVPELQQLQTTEPMLGQVAHPESLLPLSPTATVQVESPLSPLSPQETLSAPAIRSSPSPIISHPTGINMPICSIKSAATTEQRVSALDVFQQDCPQVIVESPSLNMTHAAGETGDDYVEDWWVEPIQHDSKRDDIDDDDRSMASSHFAASVTTVSHPQRDSINSVSPSPRPIPPSSVRNSLAASTRASLLGSMSRMSAIEISMLHGNSSISSRTSHVDTIRHSLQSTWRSSSVDPRPGSAHSTLRETPMSRLALAATAVGDGSNSGSHRPHMPTFITADNMEEVVVDAPVPTASFSSSTVNTVVLADEYSPSSTKKAVAAPSPASVGRTNQVIKQQQRKSAQQQQQHQASSATKLSNGKPRTAATSKAETGSAKTATAAGTANQTTTGAAATCGTVRGGRRQRGSIPWQPDEAPASTNKKTPAQLEKDKYLKSSKK